MPLAAERPVRGAAGRVCVLVGVKAAICYELKVEAVSLGGGRL